MLKKGYANVTYTDVECADQKTIEKYMDKVTVFSEVMSLKAANPYELSEGTPRRTT